MNTLSSEWFGKAPSLILIHTELCSLQNARMSEKGEEALYGFRQGN